MNHHIIKEHQLHHCLYCATKLAPTDWKSEFYLEVHYKTCRCACGKSNRIRVNFFGSGHDSWSELEKMVQK